MFTNLGAEVNERIGRKNYLKTEFDNGYVSAFNQRRNTSMSEQFTLLSVLASLECRSCQTKSKTSKPRKYTRKKIKTKK